MRNCEQLYRQDRRPYHEQMNPHILNNKWENRINTLSTPCTKWRTQCKHIRKSLQHWLPYFARRSSCRSGFFCLSNGCLPPPWAKFGANFEMCNTHANFWQIEQRYFDILKNAKMRCFVPSPGKVNCIKSEE